MKRFCPALETKLCETRQDIDRVFFDLVNMGRADAFFYSCPADMMSRLYAWQEITEGAWVIRADIKTFAQFNPAGFMVFQPGPGQSRYTHFSAYPHYDDIVVPMGLDILQWAFSNSNLSSLVGLTPKPYRHVTSFFRQAGFEPMGIVPGACYFAKRDRYCDGVASVCTRESLAAAMERQEA